jgi:hypothetical protein
MIKEHRIDPYTILLSFQSDTNFWLVDLPDTLADRYQHGLIGDKTSESIMPTWKSEQPLPQTLRERHTGLPSGSHS